jgi:hypothetical protein
LQRDKFEVMHIETQRIVFINTIKLKGKNINAEPKREENPEFY